MVRRTRDSESNAARDRRPGHLVLAGVLVHQHASVEGAYVAQGLRPRATKTQGEWIRIELERAG